jgi:hypothetical protein
VFFFLFFSLGWCLTFWVLLLLSTFFLIYYTCRPPVANKRDEFFFFLFGLLLDPQSDLISYCLKFLRRCGEREKVLVRQISLTLEHWLWWLLTARDEITRRWHIDITFPRLVFYWIGGMSLSLISPLDRKRRSSCADKRKKEKKKAYYFRYYTTTILLYLIDIHFIRAVEREFDIWADRVPYRVCVWVRNGSFPSVGLAGALNFKSAFPIALRDPVMMATLYSIIRGSSSSSSLPIYNCTLPMHIHHHNCAQKNIFPELE